MSSHIPSVPLAARSPHWHPLKHLPGPHVFAFGGHRSAGSRAALLSCRTTRDHWKSLAWRAELSILQFVSKRSRTVSCVLCARNRGDGSDGGRRLPGAKGLGSENHLLCRFRCYASRRRRSSRLPRIRPAAAGKGFSCLSPFHLSFTKLSGRRSSLPGRQRRREPRPAGWRTDPACPPGHRLAVRTCGRPGSRLRGPWDLDTRLCSLCCSLLESPHSRTGPGGLRGLGKTHTGEVSCRATSE